MKKPLRFLASPFKKKKVSWNQLQGKKGETLACRHLKKSGYTILARRFRTRFGEVDVIAKKDKVLSFIEVKFRTQSRFGDPKEALSPKKINRLYRAAMAFLEMHPEFKNNFTLEFVGMAIREYNPENRVEWFSLFPD